MVYKVTDSAGTLHHDGKAYMPGQAIPIKDEDAIAALIAIDAIVEDDGDDTPAKPKTASGKNKSKPAAGDDGKTDDGKGDAGEGKDADGKADAGETKVE